MYEGDEGHEPIAVSLWNVTKLHSVTSWTTRIYCKTCQRM